MGTFATFIHQRFHSLELDIATGKARPGSAKAISQRFNSSQAMSPSTLIRISKPLHTLYQTFSLSLPPVGPPE